MFNTRTALVKHLVSAEHRRLTVLCPWCTGKTRTFTKVSDLEVHMKSAHPDNNIPRDRFSRSNGFYFALYPADYAKIVDSVTPYDSDAAYDVRKAVRAWAEGFADKKERVEKWNSGWKEGVTIAAERKGPRGSSVTRTVVDTGVHSGRSDKRVDSESDRNREVERIHERDTVRARSPVKRKREEEGIDRSRDRNNNSRSKVTDELDEYVDDIELGEGEEQSETRKEQGAEQNLSENRNQKIRRVDNIETGGKERQVVEQRENRAEPEVQNKGDSQKSGTLESMGGVAEGSESDDGSSSSSSSSTCSSPGPGPSGALGEGLRARAYKILARGAMPVCPPARRDWSNVRKVDIECNGQELSWPPNNWRSLTPDQKLMAHEYAAMLLEKRSVGDFPVISRKALLDKYAFFALEGEGKPQDEGSDGDKIDSKIRQYNFSYVKGIVKGEIGESRMSWSILKSIEKADRWTDTDIVTDNLDFGGIKIKI